MHYTKNFLTKVILRLDFPREQKLGGDRKPQFSYEIANRFPEVLGKAVPQLNLSLSQGRPGVGQLDAAYTWEHRDKENGGRLVSVSPTYFAIEYGEGEFDAFPAFEEEFSTLFDCFQRLYAIETYSRFGLRYINEINIKEGDALDWAGLINGDLATSALAGLQEGMRLQRSMHQFQAQRDDITVLFNYGIFNPDYPNPVVRRHYVLDYDCSVTDEIPSGAVKGRLQELNAAAETMFESSIENGLRNLMGVAE